jgi:hypothetical protein
MVLFFGQDSTTFDFTWNSSFFGDLTFRHQIVHSHLFDKLSINLTIIKGGGRNKMVEHTEENDRQYKPKLGKTLVSKGYITEEELEKALSEQRVRLGEVLVRSDRITAEQLHIALGHQKEESIKIGEICKKMGYIRSEDLNWALNRMKRRLGEILIEIGVLKDSELQHSLALQKKSSQDS